MDGYSLDAQKDKLRKYAEYQDMTIVSEFSYEGFSGKNIKGRPEFTRMMEKIESGEDEIIERENYNKPKSKDSRQPGCPEEKVIAIEEALKHFQMI